MSKDYGSWSIADIKSELRKRKAKLTGKKAVLVQRLRDYDTIFGGLVNDPESTYHIKIPSAEHFFDINGDTQIPKISHKDLDTYSVLSGRENQETSKNMYNENYLLCSRAAHVRGIYYITAVCLSEMRKNVSYNVTLTLEEGTTILEAQCECAAGVGPYAQCKHVMVVIFALIDHSTNKTIKTRSTCTSQLQTFHHPKKIYNGEPVMAQDLVLKKIKNIDLADFDPRPPGLDDLKIEENFKNLIINFCAQHQCFMPIVQIIIPANKKALCHDHDYFEFNHEELFFKSMILNEEEQKMLEMRTKNNKVIWRKERVMRIQSSDFGKVYKCLERNKYKLAKSLSIAKELNTLAIKHGIKYEDSAIKKFEELTGQKSIKCGIIIHKKIQFLGCTPDGLVNENELLEVKCPYSAKDKEINAENIDYLELCEKNGRWTLKKSHDYFYQVQGQLFCTGRQKTWFCIYTITDFYILLIQRDDEFIENMVKQLNSFYNDHFRNILLNRYLYNIR